MTLFLLNSTLFAQAPDKKANRTDKKLERLTTELDLNESQVTEVKAIFQKYAERKEAMRNNAADADKTDKRAAMKQMRTDIDNEIKAVLNEDQIEKFEALPKRDHHKGRKHRKGNRGDHDKMKAIKDEKIKPILLEQRAKLEDKISENDKVAIAELRATMKAKKEALKKERETIKQSGERPTREQKKARKEAWKNSDTFKQLEALTTKYQSDIEPLLAEVEPQIKSIKEEARKAHKEDCKDGEDCKGKAKGKRKGKGKGKGTAKADKHKQKHMHRFLLLDPNESVASAGTLKPQIEAVSIYPNPSPGISQIEYTLVEDGNVAIELRDKEGNLLETVVNTTQTAGTQKVALNFKNYAVGVYYVILKDKNGQVVSKKVIR